MEALLIVLTGLLPKRLKRDIPALQLKVGAVLNMLQLTKQQVFYAFIDCI